MFNNKELTSFCADVFIADVSESLLRYTRLGSKKSSKNLFTAGYDMWVVILGPIIPYNNKQFTVIYLTEMYCLLYHQG